MRRHVGIDVSKAELVIHVLPDEQAWTQPIRHRGQRALAQRLAGMDCERIVLEASGGYEHAVLQVLREADLPAVRMAADRPRKLAQALGLHAKTDALDARLLAIAAQHIPTTHARGARAPAVSSRTAGPACGDCASAALTLPAPGNTAAER
ncbi:transposase [Xanthomonas sacchari]|uniref:IS110 family transposase n=1 Tax=Xanthomonas sacchari TaxID=56458 RepID=UPI00225E5B1E|nr:transposase [Xanthomonas sacchari]UYK79297.1 transposase [Xanthomonas sacchari]